MSRNGHDRRGIVAVVIALVVCIVLGVMHRQAERRHAPDPVIGAVRDVILMPAEALGVRMSRWTRTNVGALLAGPRLARENAALQARLGALEVQNRALSQESAENVRLRALLGFQRRSTRSLLAAEVTALKPTAQIDTLVLDRGTSSGVRVHSVVLSPAGTLVGQVIGVSRGSCVVMLLTDVDSGVGAEVVDAPCGHAGTTVVDPIGGVGGSVVAPETSLTPETTAGPPQTADVTGKESSDRTRGPEKTVRSVGVCRGLGEGQALLTYLKVDAALRPGDPIITSGLGKVFPPGIPIGTVALVTTDTTQSMRTATVRLSADIDHLDDAFIIR
ncbi:MAG: rod shape-determining protein MreC [Capsulimonadaceae bacterium]